MRKSIKRNLAYDDQKDLYYVTVHYGMRPDGSRDRCVRTFRCLDDAESTLTEFLRLRALKRTRHGGEVILADWLEVWLRDFICPNREKTTVHGYENIIRLHLVPALGEVKLPELQPAQLQRYYAERLEKGLSHNTVRKHHVLLHTALEAAVRQGLLRENVTRYVTPPAKVMPSHRYYDPAQLREAGIAKREALVEGGRLGRGRLLRFTRPLQPAAMPELLEADFPAQLRAVLEGRPPAPGSVAAVDHAPQAGAPAWPPAPLDLRPWLALLIALVVLVERWVATGPRRERTG